MPWFWLMVLASLRQSEPPRIKIAMPVVYGDLESRSIRREIRKHLPAIKHCYEVRLKRDPGLTGTLVVEFFIRPDGGVEHLAGSGMEQSPGLTGCVLRELATLQYPAVKTGEGWQVRYPFTFRPVE